MNTIGFLIKISVRDVNTSIKWYQNMLGFTKVYQHKNDWARLAIPGTDTLYGLSKDATIRQTENSDTPIGNVPSLLVSNIEQVRKDLIKKGVYVEPIQIPFWGIKLAFFKDPDGNKLCLHQDPKK